MNFWRKLFGTATTKHTTHPPSPAPQPTVVPQATPSQTNRATIGGVRLLLQSEMLSQAGGVVLTPPATLVQSVDEELSRNGRSRPGEFAAFVQEQGFGNPVLEGRLTDSQLRSLCTSFFPTNEWVCCTRMTDMTTYNVVIGFVLTGDATRNQLEVVLTCDDKMMMCWCPPGKFTMGSPESEAGHIIWEKQVEVTLTKGFWMARTPVTTGQWYGVMGTVPSFGYDYNAPVEQVSWNDVQDFIAKVNASNALPKSWKMALPTDAQWEYACRAGDSGPYSGGSVDEVAWYGNNRKTQLVATKKPNAWGLYDMHGNVFEWCSDWDYEDVKQGGVDPSGPSTGLNRVVRGGAGNSEAKNCRAAHWLSFPPSKISSSVGFRPVLVPTE